MAKTERFCRPTLWIEFKRDWSGQYFVAWQPNESRLFSDRRALLKWLAWPSKTPTGDELREWLDGLERSPEAPAGLPTGDALVDGSFDPLAHALDPSDPQYATRTII